MKREFLRFALKNSNTYIIHFLISWHQQASCPSPGFWFHWLQTFCICLLACFKHLVILRIPNVTINKLMCLRTYFLAILWFMSGWWKALEVAYSSSMLCTSSISHSSGWTTLGHGAVDINIQGPGVAVQHCYIENKSAVITLNPCGNLCAIDGLLVSQPVRLSQGRTQLEHTTVSWILSAHHFINIEMQLKQTLTQLIKAK